jgi:hypothetical protein
MVLGHETIDGILAFCNWPTLPLEDGAAIPERGHLNTARAGQCRGSNLSVILLL